MFYSIGKVAFISCLALLSSLATAASTQINFATAYAADSFQAQNLQKYADEVAQATAGQVIIKVHPAGSLLKPTEIYPGVRNGKADGGEVIMSSLAKEYPLLGIDALPFIVSGYGDARLLWEASRPSIDSILRSHGLQLLYSVPWPPQNLYSNRPITGMQDFKGLRMRVYNPTSERVAQLIGALPTTIQAIDVSKAIEVGEFDSMFTSSWTGVDTRAWTKMNYYYQANAWFPKNMVFISRKAFERLDKESQQKLLAAARVAEQRGWQLSRDTDRSSEEQLRARGVHVERIAPSIRSSFDRVGLTVMREWLRYAGREEQAVLIRYTTERARN